MMSPIFLCSTLSTQLDVDNKILAEQILANKDVKKYADPQHTFNEDSDYPETTECQQLIMLIDNFIQQNVHSKYFTYTQWSHILEPKEQTMMHTHVNRQIFPETLSWVYYVDVPENSGDLAFWLNVGSKTVVHNVQAQAGTLIIFPDWIPHYTYKNASDSVRISVSGNARCDEKDVEYVLANPENLYNVVGITND